MLAAEEDRPDVVRLLLLHKAHADAMSRQAARMLPLHRESDKKVTGQAIPLLRWPLVEATPNLLPNFCDSALLRVT